MSQDSCGMYNGEERRKHCEMVVSLKVQYEEDKKVRDEWRRDVNQKLESIIQFLQEIKGPYKVGLWAFRLFIGGLLAGFAALSVKFFRDHWQ